MHDIANDALNETNAAIERMNKAIFRAQEDCRDEIVAIELRRIARHTHRMKQFEGGVPDGSAVSETTRNEPPIKEADPAVVITSHWPTQQAHLIGDEGDPRGMPRILKRPNHDAS